MVPIVKFEVYAASTTAVVASTAAATIAPRTAMVLPSIKALSRRVNSIGADPST
jgi:hypothetical protein